MTGSHSANLNLDYLHSDLPPQATTATVLPSLKQPLLSLGQFCDAGSNIILTKDHIYIQPHQHTNVQQATNISTRNQRNGLWDIPLATNTTTCTDFPLMVNTAFTAYNYDTKADLISFLHAAAFSPTVSTWCDAIDAGYFPTWPGLTSKAVRKHLPKAMATYKGHQKEIKQGLRSTSKQTSNKTSPNPATATIDTATTSNAVDMTVPNGTRTNIAFLAQLDVGGLVATDQTGRFPVTSSSGSNT